jgi:hypothetical protein
MLSAICPPPPIFSHTIRLPPSLVSTRLYFLRIHSLPAWGNTVGNGSTFHVEVPGWRTTEQPISTKTKDNLIAGFFGAQASLPFFTILITLDNGKVAAIEYDPDTSCNSDAACAVNRNLCVGNMCGVDAATCRTSTEPCSTNPNLDPLQYCCPVGATCNDCDLKVSAACCAVCCAIDL